MLCILATLSPLPASDLGWIGGGSQNRPNCCLPYPRVQIVYWATFPQNAHSSLSEWFRT